MFQYSSGALSAQVCIVSRIDGGGCQYAGREMVIDCPQSLPEDLLVIWWTRFSAVAMSAYETRQSRQFVQGNFKIVEFANMTAVLDRSCISKVMGRHIRLD